MTISRGWFNQAFVAGSAAGAAIVIEHLAATEITRSLDIPPEFDIRVGQFLGTATILGAFAAIADDRDGAGEQVGKLMVIACGAGFAAVSCSAARWAVRTYRAANQHNGRIAERATTARGEGLVDWKSLFESRN